MSGGESILGCLTENPPGVNGAAEALEIMRPQGRRGEQFAHQPPRFGADDQRPGICDLLETCRQVGGLTDERFLPCPTGLEQIANYNKPGRNAYTAGERICRGRRESLDGVEQGES